MLDTCLCSPALSVCDSLDDQDLDALLAGLGSLSHFATPPLKDGVTVEVNEVLGDESEDDDDANSLDYSRIARHFADQTSNTPFTHLHHDTTLIQDILSRAQLPPELLAISFNILRLYASHAAPNPNHNERNILPTDLLAVTALALAASYTHDHPPKTSWWAREICCARFSSSEIDHAKLHILLTVDWALLRLSTPEAIEHATEILFSPLAPLPAQIIMGAREAAGAPPALKRVVLAPLKIAIGTSLCATWAEGQLTPADTPLGSPLDVPRAYFLPLL
ncbi:hypothetical protein LTR35_010219 [Friedmanniomyces endolithicus]|uniref:Cyclin N-terminal domain-containing protein n=1 Tax=Friedmanniomyces endolithicus TaxID=329885 RepID=A0AAN6FD43_9PEZI|nr:hypothetical protein LTR35_010219 [Friedmanniomyces endolithicus]KAK0282704.1 hypothetical protein LTS00_012006 [Friedmanniomyces endolithicus]KAK0311593.1 hypothetical protein LTR82_014295 [Friedmanniomyces endolithicus]KAK0987524.1 hypothetical protein LTR54_013116 [Friedmanniomyces endolithicus]